MFSRSRIRERAFLMPLDWYLFPHDAAERNRAFREEGYVLLESAVRECLDSAGVTPARVGQVVFATTTGMSAPSLDARLVNGLGMQPSVARLPVWGLGCAAGAAGIARAADFCAAHPGSVALVAVLETCSLNFAPDDLSPGNLITAALFADCAAAVLVAGDAAPEAEGGVRIEAARSFLFPGTERLMGWDVTAEGFRLVLPPELPSVLRETLPRAVAEFLAEREVGREEVPHVLAHPGGAKILDVLPEALGFPADRFSISEEVLGDFGNVSSASVLLVLERWLVSDARSVPGAGLLASFGPGFAAEFVLVRS